MVNMKGFFKKSTMIGAAAALTLSLAACSGNSSKTASSSDSPVNIIITNGKGEIDAQFKQAAKDFMKEYPKIHVDVESVAVGDTLNIYDKLTASGKTVTMAMFDPYSTMHKYKNVGIDLSNEKWNADTTYALKDANGKVVGFPFAVEGMGLVYNQKVLDKAVGGTFDPFSINTQDKLKALLDKIKASGVNYPVAYQTEAWSVGNHFSSLFLNQESDPNTMLDQLKAGKLDLTKNAVWNGYYNTMDILASKDYDKYGDRPLGQYYDSAHVAVGKGESAILFNGDWAYDSLKAVAGDNFGFMPVPVDNNQDNPLNNKIPVGPTQVMVINKKASKEQQDAAKKFLNWLVYDKAGQDFVVNKSQVISAFKNNTNKVTNPLGVAISNAIAQNKTMPFSTNYINPADWSTIIGPEVQKYIGKQESRADLAKALESYYTSHQD
ncbi:carbohydrate ABC transporter substrate-binding protein [Bacillus sp. BRMEA1]|uniref:ABC transporter substrate-binding protein n=1 Tax=Neobacillus endophyticus TaxID=2738405 RepID=UPI001565D22D|nr:ABC transporter substrate-binding protein [Neobacillus endophyticus]NRD77925.1 carbohydrate ABC transporter substrate-binding protein [Neobacillus endophyticus]